MSMVLCVLTSDPNLLGCELHRLWEQVGVRGEPGSNAVGMGGYEEGEALLRRLPSGAEVTEGALVPAHESSALLYHSQRLPMGLSLEDHTQPFRMKKWLFAHVGRVPGFEKARAGLLERLPDFLKRQVGGEAEGEVAFGLFLRRLWEAGVLEDERLEVERAGAYLAEAAWEVAQASAEAGEARAPVVNLVATNGELLVASRRGEAPLYYTRLEGMETCEVCGLTARTLETQPKVVEHRRVRTVVVASDVKRPAGWVELADGATLAVSADLRVRTLGP